MDCQLARSLVLVHLGGGALLVQLDAKSLILLGHALLDDGVKVPEESIVADEQVCLDAERIEHARELDRNVPRTDESDLLGQGSDIEEAVAVGAELGAGDLRSGRRVAADSDEDLFGVDGCLGAVVEGDFDFVAREDLGPAVDVLDLVIV